MRVHHGKLKICASYYILTIAFVIFLKILDWVSWKHVFWNGADLFNSSSSFYSLRMFWCRFTNKKCDRYGKCTCKAGCAGNNCSSCAAGFYSISFNGQLKCIGINNLINTFENITSNCRCLHSRLTVFPCKYF